MATCYLNNVYLCYLPTHCSYGLQPLDNCLFSALKARYRRHLEDYNFSSNSTPIDKVNFIRCFKKARDDAYTMQNIKASFRVTGV